MFAGFDLDVFGGGVAAGQDEAAGVAEETGHLDVGAGGPGDDGLGGVAAEVAGGGVHNVAADKETIQGSGRVGGFLKPAAFEMVGYLLDSGG